MQIREKSWPKLDWHMILIGYFAKSPLRNTHHQNNVINQERAYPNSVEVHGKDSIDFNRVRISPKFSWCFAPRLLHKTSWMLTVEEKVCSDGKYIWWSNVIGTETRLEKGHGPNPECTYMHTMTQRKGRLSDERLGVRVDESMLPLLCLCVQYELS